MVTDDDFDDALDDDDELDGVVGDDLDDADDADDLDDSDDDADDDADAGDDDADEDEDDSDDDDEEEEASLEVLLGRDGDVVDDVRSEDVADVAKSRVAVGEGEFTCRSCFLVKRRAQLADEEQMICLDCA